MSDQFTCTALENHQETESDFLLEESANKSPSDTMVFVIMKVISGAPPRMVGGAYEDKSDAYTYALAEARKEHALIVGQPCTLVEEEDTITLLLTDVEVEVAFLRAYDIIEIPLIPRKRRPEAI